MFAWYKQGYHLVGSYFKHITSTIAARVGKRFQNIASQYVCYACGTIFATPNDKQRHFEKCKANNTKEMVST